MKTFDTDEKLNRFLPCGVEGEIGEWLSTWMDVGEDGGDVINAGELGAVGIRRRAGSSTSKVSSSGIASSCLDDGLVALPGMKYYIFTIDVGKKIKYSYPVNWHMASVWSSPNLVQVMLVDVHLKRYEWGLYSHHAQ